MWYSGYLYCKSSFNYISLNSRSGQVQILLTGCRRFLMGEELWQWYRIEIRLDAPPSSPIQKKQFMIISLLYSLHSLVSPVSLQKWIFVNSDQKLWKADIKASADIQFCLVFCLYFLLFYRYFFQNCGCFFYSRVEGKRSSRSWYYFFHTVSRSTLIL